MGATVLLVIGILGFPLVFETQPRPVPVDLPIDIPAKDGAPALAMPAPSTAGTASPGATLPQGTTSLSESERQAVAHAAAAPRVDAAEDDEPASAAGKTAPPPAEAAPEPARSPRVPAPRPAMPEKAPAPPVRAPLSAPSKAPPLATPAAADNAKAASPEADRYVVQVGAFADANLAHDARMKVERMGLKTYTQVIDAAAGKRIRVRVGPFAEKGQADQAAAKIKAGGLAAAVLTL
jgi:DedD protein